MFFHFLLIILKFGKNLHDEILACHERQSRPITTTSIQLLWLDSCNVMDDAYPSASIGCAQILADEHVSQYCWLTARASYQCRIRFGSGRLYKSENG